MPATREEQALMDAFFADLAIGEAKGSGSEQQRLDAEVTAAAQIVEENEAAGRKCKHASYLWHQIDGYCRECQIHIETDEQIQARRTLKGYR